MSGTHVLPDLPDYSYNGLEPYISKQIMELHHDKHHKAYVDALNEAEATFGALSPKARIARYPVLKFNGGGHINHSLFWKILDSPPDGTYRQGNGGVIKDGPLKQAIEKQWGHCDAVGALIKDFNAIAKPIQGSGWGWLGYNIKSKVLEIVTTDNQDPLLTHEPIIGIDVWEHAYYLQYFNDRGAYLEKIWKVINWEEAEKRYVAAVSGVKY